MTVTNYVQGEQYTLETAVWQRYGYDGIDEDDEICRARLHRRKSRLPYHTVEYLLV